MAEPAANPQQANLCCHDFDPRGLSNKFAENEKLKSNGLIPKKLSLVQGVWRDPFKRSCFKILGNLRKNMSEARRHLYAFVWSRQIPGASLPPKQKGNPRSWILQNVFLRIWYVVIVSLASCVALHPLLPGIYIHFRPTSCLAQLVNNSTTSVDTSLAKKRSRCSISVLRRKLAAPVVCACLWCC